MEPLYENCFRLLACPRVQIVLMAENRSTRHTTLPEVHPATIHENSPYPL